MKKVSVILQAIIKAALIFLFIFIWVRYFVRELWLALVISAALSILIDISTRVISSKISKKKTLKEEEKEEAENMFLSMALSKKKVDFFYNLLSSRRKCEKKKNFVCYDCEFGTEVIFPYMKFEKLSPDALAEIYCQLENQNVKKIIIPCGEIDKDAQLLAKNLPVEIIMLDKYDTYSKIYSKYECYPEITNKYKKDAKATFKELLSYSFNKQRTLGYLFAALILIIASVFVRRNIYYCIMASLLVLFALVSFTNPFFNTKTEDSPLF